MKGLIPEIDDIPKTPTNYKKTTTNRKLITGKRHGKIEVKLYQQEGSSFARIQFVKDKDEYIFKMRADGCYEDGIYREITVNGDTEIGSDYKTRWGRKVRRVYLLKKINETGIILYRAYLENTDGLNILNEYCFNSKTLKWTKQDISSV